MSKKNIVFYGSIVSALLGIVGFFLCSDVVKPIYQGFMIGYTMPLLLCVFGGVSASIFIENKKANAKNRK